MLGGFVKKTSPCYVQLMDSSTLFCVMWKNGRHPFQSPAIGKSSTEKCLSWLRCLVYFSYSKWDLYKNLRKKTLCRSPGLGGGFFRYFSIFTRFNLRKKMFKTILAEAIFSHFGLVQSTIPICSRYGIFTYSLLKFMTGVGKYSIPIEHLGYSSQTPRRL